MVVRTSHRLLLARKEASYGTGEDLVGTDGIFARTFEINPFVATSVERQFLRGYMGNYQTLLLNRTVELTIECELAGSGTKGTPPNMSPLLVACGLTQTLKPAEEAAEAADEVIYTPRSSGYEGCTVFFYQEQNLQKVVGCRGTFEINANAGEIPTITFTLLGFYADPENDTVPTDVSTSNVGDPLVFNGTNTTAQQFFQKQLNVQTFTFAQNNEYRYRELITRPKEVLITDRKPNGTLVCEMPLQSSNPLFSNLSYKETDNNTWQHGKDEGNIVVFSAPQTAMTGITYSDDGNIQMANITYNALPSDAGDDDYSLTFK